MGRLLLNGLLTKHLTKISLLTYTDGTVVVPDIDWMTGHDIHQALAGALPHERTTDVGNEILNTDDLRFVGLNIPTPQEPVHVVTIRTVEVWVRDMTQHVYTVCGKEVRIQWAGKMRMDEDPMCQYCLTFVDGRGTDGDRGGCGSVH
jgi:hypothetical protein